MGTDISKEHRETLTPKSIRNQFGWMMLKYNIHFKEQASLNDELILKTWAEDFSTFKSSRKTIITHKNTTQIIFESLAQWCFVHLHTKKPHKIVSELSSFFFKTL